MPQISTSLDYFPLSVAEGDAFCNRLEEITQLKTCIEQLRPVLLVSPRRYGKTSLAIRAITQMKMPFAQFDFFSVVEESDIEKVILQGAGKLISQMETIPQKALKLASELFDGTHIRAVLTKMGVSIEINRRKEKPAYHVLDILEKIERLAQKTDKKIILFFDEFQCVGEIASNHAMESVLRQVAQLTKSIAFIFSGSNRHLLNQMFEDRTRPFYKLCERIALDRISETAYINHIQLAAKAIWRAEISSQVLNAIFSVTARHPYYVNLLCSRLWRGELPDAEMVHQTWYQYAKEERSSVSSEMELLSKNQRKLLTILARVGETKAPLGSEFIQKARMAKASIEQSLNFLEQKDYIYKDENGYTKLLDPLIQAVLSEDEW